MSDELPTWLEALPTINDFECKDCGRVYHVSRDESLPLACLCHDESEQQLCQHRDTGRGVCADCGEATPYTPTDKLDECNSLHKIR